MNVSAGRHAEAALQPGGEVGDDVAEHVIGDHHIEWPRIAHHLHAERIDIHVLRRDPRMRAAYFFEDTLPQSAGMGHRVRLVTHENALAGGAVELGVALTILEGVADDALPTFAGVDVLLNRDFIRRALLENPAGIGVDALGVLADDDKIYILRL